ncbi:glutathione S-transferase 1-like [Hyposmocoma kahamanoa]|uniref:glutathione S-transferase 1-like n=1 Tax=Hyposmocoma kahamanoa TaxID=1477025 RepID=UPI000E6D9836|nr:glutathione S-transferase 1-like [Hyposmocoma kahamanoa]
MHTYTYKPIKMSKLVLWHLKGSPPSWSVRIMAQILGLELELKEIDFVAKEHKSPEFKKLNAMGTIPVLQDGDFCLAESHSIIKYLLDKYGNEEQQALYPSEVRERALVDQAMFFDTGVAFIRVKNVALPIIFDGAKEVTSKLVESIEDVYDIVEDFLSRHQYIALDRYTIADLSVGTTIAALNGTHKIETKRYSRTTAWLDKLNEDAYFRDIAVSGAEILKDTLITMLKKNNDQ